MNNIETPDHWRDLHLSAVSVAGRLNSNLKICSPGLQAIFVEFQDKYLHYPDTPDECKRTEEKFRTIWNVPDAVGEINWKYIAMKKQKKTGNEYKGFFSLILLQDLQRQGDGGKHLLESW